jgi:hypothetical protein
MPLPPDDDLLDSLMDQLGGALEGLPVDIEATKIALDDGLREALAQLNADPTEGPPTMRLLQGGRNKRPDGPVPFHDADDLEDEPPVAQTTRRVVRTASVHNLSRRGTIALDGADDWQTVYRGPTPSTYRLLATQGTLQVSLDGTLVEQISSGRSSDVCGQVIRLRSDAPATGVYLRLE